MSARANEHARALADLGAAKGGRERANRLPADRRREIAREAARARWGDTLPQATHTGMIEIGGRSLACAVLENGKRLLTQETFLKAIGRAAKAIAGTGSELLIGGLPPFLVAENLQDFIPDELREGMVPIAFRTDRGARGYGYDAKLLPMVCDVYLTAREKKRLLASQKHIADACSVLVRGLARVGIIALVDEATGYQEERAKDELHQILEAYISPELLPWTKLFPDDFFRQIYRLNGWEYRPGTAKRNQGVGKFINKHVYEALPDGVLDELRARNPITENGRRRYRHHQLLTTDTGNPHLDKQITAVLTLMRVANDKDEFVELFNRAYAKQFQHRLPLVIDTTAVLKG